MLCFFELNKNIELWRLLYILMVDRVECTLKPKVRNAHRVGAAAVIIWDNTRLCLAESDTPHLISLLIKTFIGRLSVVYFQRR